MKHNKEIKKRERKERAIGSCVTKLFIRCITYNKCSHLKVFEISNFNKINEILELLQ